ncbi:MAG: SGNH/GDSL hydrolase family protein [Acidimicrobiia bacterium]|nr:SGNH/GDSL hydrolase family protein [Acidimicrobiia bacterium]
MGQPRPGRFLALGDSYTIGESVPPEAAWPRQLADRLLQAGVVLEPTIIATTAWTSGELLAAFDAASPAAGFSLVSLQIGVNDQFRRLPIGEFSDNVLALLGRARSMRDGVPGGVFMVSIPDWGVTPFAAEHDPVEVGADIDRFNAALADLAADAGIPLVNVTAASRVEGALLAADGLHPAAGQYRQWVELILPVAAALVGA